ncbi:MAG: ABC transporter permease subunit [Mesorhizobium sp.]|uniref:ABC transporter permease n=1 Tax=Mesorhizobium sp. TaxID=1871066 RepID=UPI001ACF5B6E|nr:ABC transporter permease subunit [Mesorhizobium sp.]MBN9218130.1 ABC transporter permease subunit [Mesorhizobium sp.]
MSADIFRRVTFRAYLALFLFLLMAPLLVMTASAFNTPSYPQAWPIEGFTFAWFSKLMISYDLIEGLGNSLIIALAVTALSVPIGLAAAIVMSQLQARFRAIYYLVAISPMLTPGIITGVATVVFWRETTRQIGLTFLYNGLFLSVAAQTTFVSTLCMLIILARLQRFDPSQEEAALDLGASPLQIFTSITLPFLRPALISSVVLSLLSSIEEFNATTFTILAQKTLTTVLAGRIRVGLTPEISALAVLIVSLTLIGAVAHEIFARHKSRRAKAD